MKWRTHTAIAKAIADVLGLDGSLRKALSSGSIDPDRRPDVTLRVSGRGRVYVARAPHHNPGLRVVMRHVWRARRSYLGGDDFEALRSLGRALHYIQDMSASKGFLGLSHDSVEGMVALLNIPVKVIEEGLSSAVCSPHYIEKTVRQVKPQKDAGKALEEACRASASVAGAVVGRKNPPEGLVDDFAQARRRYWSRTIPVAAAASLLFLAFALATQNVAVALGAVSGYIIQLLDRRYHYLRKEAEWYGVR
ncbi:MAG: hypothetical protein KIH01_06240 [Candidatus Freyarchaeota archaeon]|nr:hypothetical protein [Candidatus Jordarchaeia archaeon]